MPQTFTLGDLADAGEVGQPRLDQGFTLGPLDDEGQVGNPRLLLEWGPISSTEFPAGAPGLGVVLPEVALQLVDLDHQHVTWLPLVKAGAAARGALSDPGAVTTTLSRSDPDLADVEFEDRILRYWLRGELVAAALVSTREDASIDQGEEAAQEAPIGGPGTLAILADGVVEPWKLDWDPDMRTVRFNFAHPDYDDSTWGPAYEKSLQGVESPWWTGFPRGWPDPSAAWVSGPLGNSENAPDGITYARASFTITTAGLYALFWTGDNTAQMFIDGVELGVIQNWQQLQRVEVQLSAGTHVMAVKVENWVQAFANPTGFVMTLMTVGGQGQLGDVVFRSQASGWKVLQFPTVEPGWTHGKALNWILDKWETSGGRVTTRTWTDLVDSASQAWPLVPEITVQVGQSILDVAGQFGEAYMDLSMAAGSWTMHAWNKGGQGQALNLSLAGPDLVDESVASLMSLRHRSTPPLATDLMVRWEKNWLRRSVSVPGARRREKHLQLPTVATAAGAQAIADEVLAVYGRERVEHSARILPRNDAQVPGIAIREGDTLDLPDRDGVLATVRVHSWSVMCDADGKVAYQIEAGDLVTFREEAITTWLRRLSDGALGGQTRQSLPDRRDSYAYSAAVMPVREMPFDHNLGDPTGESKPWTLAAPGIITDFTVDIPGGEGGTFEVYVNGVSVSSLTVAAAATADTKLGLAISVVRGDAISVYSLEEINYVLTVRMS